MKKEPQHTESNTGQVQQLMYKYVPYWPVFIVLFILMAAYTTWYLSTAMPVFRANAEIEIKDEKKGAEYSKVEQLLNPLATKNIIENQIEIIGSIPVFTQVSRKLNLSAPTFQQTGWKGYKIGTAYETSPIDIEVKHPDRIVSPKVNKIYFIHDAGQNKVEINGKAYPMNEWVKTQYDTLKFVVNPRYKPVPPAIAAKQGTPKFFFSLVNEAAVIKGLEGGFSASQKTKLSTVLDLRFSDLHPKKAEAVLDAIVGAYHNLTIERTNQMAMNTLAWIDHRLANVSGELDSLESGIQNFRTQTGTVDINEQGRLYLSGAQYTDQQKVGYDLQLSALEEVERFIKSRDNRAAISPSMLNSSDPTLKELILQLSTAESKYEQLKPTTGENSPVMITLREEIGKLRPKILDNIENQRQIINSGIQKLKDKNSEYAAKLTTLPKNQRQLIEVSRAQNIKNEIYTFLLSKREEIAYQINSVDYSSMYVNTPTSGNGPVSPNINMMAVLTLIVPLALGMGLVSMKDLLSSKILYRADVEKLTSYPFAGEIIFEKIDYTRSPYRSFALEQFRHLRNNLKFHSEPGAPLKRVLVTSSIMGEGKSFVSINLAKSFARSGKSVALLELDLHRPKLREFFGIDEVPGISDYLAGTATEKEIVVPIDGKSGLALIPSGTLGDEASELLLGPNFEILLNYLDTQFDILIIDSAPVKAISDAYVISPLVQLTLFVIRHNHTPKSIVINLDNEIQSHNLRNVALVFNGIKSRGYGKFSYGFGHGYGYDYKSTYEEYNRKKRK